MVDCNLTSRPASMRACFICSTLLHSGWSLFVYSSGQRTGHSDLPRRSPSKFACIAKAILCCVCLLQQACLFYATGKMPSSKLDFYNKTRQLQTLRNEHLRRGSCLDNRPKDATTRAVQHSLPHSVSTIVQMHFVSNAV